MITLLLLLYDEGQTTFSKKLCLFSFKGVLTNFLQILQYIAFFNCLYRFLGIASVRGMRPGNETRQQSIWSAVIRFSHALSGSKLASIHSRP